MSRVAPCESRALWGKWLGMGVGRRSGHSEGTWEGLHSGLRMCVHRGEEATARRRWSAAGPAPAPYVSVAPARASRTCRSTPALMGIAGC